MKPITLDDLRSLPPFIDLMTAAGILGIGRTKAYDLARRGRFPCHVVLIGASYKVSLKDLLKLMSPPEDA
ncbi:helix-turn-helix domain-containing protein [Actinocorallia sp. A-T 12471]|uniref:helix-turn-helix domain-containing protein n=1 Tax=Actinocorallia sp. A-T 12471 TaxID=3089813 RepID=UPI0029D38FD2|nr:helix-turn-helix domain-containing protein [Actinocorallia sp. A-T 12471]MDX6738694.1 helix-turn-helix domain-containing protein [Actinocorallia sp. A-T 12471]